MWSPVQTIRKVSEDDFENREEAPISRSKHAMCSTSDGHIYLLGGRSGNRPLKDLWRLDPGQNTWEEVKCWGDQPPNLQEHTMTPWKDKLYVFGGEVGCSSSTETPLWILDLGTCIWRQGNSGPSRSKPGTVMHPSGRRAHTAILYKDSIHIYGGYQDLKGSSSELWSFNLDYEQWHLVSCSLRCSDQPSPRHSHSAIVHETCMWVYGGMTDLQEKGDFWKWNFDTSQWSKVKCNKGPGNLHSHSAIKAFGCMFIFGGERDGQLLQDLWRYHFGSNVWEKIVIEGLMPNPRCRHTAVANPSLDIAAWDAKEDEENCLTKMITRSQSKSSYILSKSVSKSSNLVPTKSISMCFGHTQETPLHEPNCKKNSNNNKVNNSKTSSTNNNNNNRNKMSSKQGKFKIHHPMKLRLCSKESFTISDEEEDTNDGDGDDDVAGQDEDENDENGGSNGQAKLRKSLKEKISQSRLVRSISSSSYSKLHNQANESQESGKNELKNLIEESGANNHQQLILNNETYQMIECFEEDEGSDELECDLDLLRMSKSQSSDPVLEAQHDLVIRKRIEGALRFGQKVRPKSEVLEGLFHLESLLEHGEYDCPQSTSSAMQTAASASVNRQNPLNRINKRHTVSESMSYYSLCFPSPPVGRRVGSPEETSTSATPNGSSINGDDDTSSTSIATNKDSGSSSNHDDKETGDQSMSSSEEGKIQNQLDFDGNKNCGNISFGNRHYQQQQSDETAANIPSQSIHFDDHFYKALASPADAQARTSGYNSAATLYTPSCESQIGFPHSMSHSSGYHSLAEDSLSFDPIVINPFHQPSIHGYNHHATVNQQYQQNHPHQPISSFVPRRLSRLSRDNSSFELKQLSGPGTGFNVRLSKDIRSRARERAALRGHSLSSASSSSGSSNNKNSSNNNNYNNNQINSNNLTAAGNRDNNKLWQQINVIKEVVVPSSPASRKWSYSPARSKIHQHHWQLCMYVFGGREQGVQPMYKQPISVWKFYI